MLVELDVKELKLSDLKAGDWFVPFGINVHFNRKASVWMVVDIPTTLFIGNQVARGMRCIVKVAHVYIPEKDEHNHTGKSEIKSVVPIGTIDEMNSDTSVLPLDHEKDVLKLKEKIL